MGLNNAIFMCRYILPLPADTITPVQQGIFVTCGFVSNTKPYQAFKAKDHPQGQGRGQGQGQGQGLGLQIQGQGLDASRHQSGLAKAKDKDFGLKDQGQGLTSLLLGLSYQIWYLLVKRHEHLRTEIHTKIGPSIPVFQGHTVIHGNYGDYGFIS